MDLMERNHRKPPWNMPKISQKRKVNKRSQSHLVAKISKFQNSKMEFFISLTIPENMNALGGTIKTQWAIVSFEKIREKWLNDESSLVFASYLWNESR